MTCMDKLPTVISCCFCCFLRAGTVLIALFSFISGLMLAPNVSVGSKGFWNMNPILSYYTTGTENVIQILLGVISIMLCIVSVLLMVGALCNVPILIEIYQWGALVYCCTVFVLFFILAMFCFFIHSNSLMAGVTLIILMFASLLFTVYFIIVTNSLRMSLKILTRGDLTA